MDKLKYINTILYSLALVLIQTVCSACRSTNMHCHLAQLYCVVFYAACVCFCLARTLFQKKGLFRKLVFICQSLATIMPLVVVRVFSLCLKPEMRCNTIFTPSVTVMSIVLLILTVVEFIFSNKEKG